MIEGHIIFPAHTTLVFVGGSNVFRPLSLGSVSSSVSRLLCGLWLRLTCSPFSRAEVVLKGGYGFTYLEEMTAIECCNLHKSKLELQSWRIGQANVFCAWCSTQACQHRDTWQQSCSTSYFDDLVAATYIFANDYLQENSSVPVYSKELPFLLQEHLQARHHHHHHHHHHHPPPFAASLLRRFHHVRLAVPKLLLRRALWHQRCQRRASASSQRESQRWDTGDPEWSWTGWVTLWCLHIDDHQLSDIVNDNSILRLWIVNQQQHWD